MNYVSKTIIINLLLALLVTIFCDKFLIVGPIKLMTEKTRDEKTVKRGKSLNPEISWYRNGVKLGGIKLY